MSCSRVSLYSASIVNMQRIHLIQSQPHYATTKSQVFIIKNDIIYFFPLAQYVWVNIIQIHIKSYTVL